MGLLSTCRFIVRHPLSRGRRAESLLRYLRWQIGARLVPGPVAVDFVNGAKLLAAPGMTGATGNVYVGLHEFEDMAFVLHFLRPGDLFVDVGANIGSYAVLAGAGVGADGIAFEPDGAAFGWLARNIGLNGIAHSVEARQQALGGEARQAKLTIGGDTTNHVVVDGQAAPDGGQTVQMTTLDEALVGRVPAMLKIDVEGFETEVLNGARDVLGREGLRCIILELIGGGERYGFDEDELRRRLAGLGFGEYAYAPFERRLHPRDRASGGNVLFVRDLPFVQARVASAAPFVVRGTQV